jgi:predicted RNA-binding protein with PIN domain
MWIIDAYNVLGARPDGWWRNRALALAGLLDDIAAWRPDADRVVVMVDGWPRTEVPERSWNGIDVRYAHRRGPDGADRAIVDLVHEAGDASEITVVTSDGQLRAQVMDLGAAVEGAGTFRDRLDAGT